MKEQWIDSVDELLVSSLRSHVAIPPSRTDSKTQNYSKHLIHPMISSLILQHCLLVAV